MDSDFCSVYENRGIQTCQKAFTSTVRCIPFIGQSWRLSVDQVKIQQYSRQRNAYASFDTYLQVGPDATSYFLKLISNVQDRYRGCKVGNLYLYVRFLCVRPTRPPEVTANDQGKH